MALEKFYLYPTAISVTLVDNVASIVKIIPPGQVFSILSRSYFRKRLCDDLIMPIHSCPLSHMASAVLNLFVSFKVSNSKLSEVQEVTLHYTPGSLFSLFPVLMT
jgi:hypothetical protein